MILVLLLLLLLFANIGDGSELLNLLLSDADLRIPPIEFPLHLIGAKSSVNCSIELSCSQVEIGSIGLDTEDSKNKFHLLGSVNHVSMDCSGVLQYKSDDRWIDSGKIGLEVFTGDTALSQDWSFVWRHGKDRRKSLPSRIEMKKCKPRVRYTDESFRVIGGWPVLSFAEQQILNTLAPLLGLLVVDPVFCIAADMVTNMLSFALSFLHWHVDWFLKHQLPQTPKTVGQLEATVVPRNEEKDWVVRLDNWLTQFSSDLVREVLASPSISAGGETLAINQLIRDHLLSNGSGSAWVLLNSSDVEAMSELFHVDIGGGSVRLLLAGVSITGIDSVEELSLLEILGNYTLDNQVQLSNPLQVTVSLIVEERGESRGRVARFPFEVGGQLENVQVQLSTLVGIDAFGVWNLTLGSLEHAPMECLLSTLANLTFPSAYVSPDVMLRAPFVRGDDEIFSVLDAVSRAAVTVFADPLLNMFRQHSSTLLQFVAKNFLEPSLRKASCPTKPWPPPLTPNGLDNGKRKIIPWHGNRLISFARWVFNTLIGTSGDISVNRLTDWALDYIFGPPTWQGNMLHINGTVLALGPIDLLQFFPFLDPPASATLRVYNLSLSGFDTYQTLDCLETESENPFAMWNNVSLDQVQIGMNIAAKIVGLNNNGQDIEDDLFFSFALSQNSTAFFSIFVEYLIMIDELALEYFQPSRLLSPCAAYLFPPPPTERSKFSSVQSPLALTSLDILLGSVSVTSVCRNCSTPALPSALDFISRPESSQDILSFLEVFLPAVSNIVTNSSDTVWFGGANANFGVNNLLDFLRKVCNGEKKIIPYHPVQPQKTLWWLPNMKVLMVVSALCMLFGFAASVLLAKRRSSSLRKHQSKRIATTLLQTDYLNTGGSSSNTPGSTITNPSPFFGDFTLAQGANVISSRPLLEQEQGRYEDSHIVQGQQDGTKDAEGATQATRESNASSSSSPSPSLPTFVKAKGSRRTMRKSCDSASSSVTGSVVRFSEDSGASPSVSNSLENIGGTGREGALSPLHERLLMSPDDGQFSPAGGKDFHREVVLEFRRRVSICSVSRNSVIQSPREVVSETDALYLLGHDRAMIVHPSISRSVAFGIVVLLFVDFLMFVTGNFFTMGRVTIILKIAGDQWKEIPMLTMTLDYCIDLLSEAGALLFFVFIGFCSGILPWARVAFLAYAWVVPANVLTVPHRGYLLRTMESMGKWIMAIFYLFALMTASMNTTIKVPQEYMRFLPEDTVVGYVEFVPMWGLISFFFAALLSVLLNHLIIYYHNRIVAENWKAMQVEHIVPGGGASTMVVGPGMSSLNQYRPLPDNPISEEEEGSDFSLDGPNPEDSPATSSGEQQHGSLDRIFRTLVSAGLLAWPVLFYLSFATMAYEFEFMGVSGVGAELFGVNGGKIRSESLYSLFPALIHADPAEKTNWIALFFMEVAYFVLIILTPALAGLICLALWFMPLSKQRAQNLLFMLRVTNSWNSTNVLCASILIMALEIFKFFDVVAENLPFCPQIFGDVVHELGASAKESVCFGVESRIKEGWYYLVIYVVYSFVLTRAVFYYVALALEHDFDRLTILFI